MKVLVLLFGLLALAAAETYSTENDNLDIEAVIANIETHQAFLDCFLDRKPCDEVQADFKKDLPDAIPTACEKCTEAQKHLFNRFLAATKANIPQGYNDLKSKYDSNGKYFAVLEEAIANA